ncbi:MAG: hypothetical protein OEW11_07380 [Nitrospirota bacterium]|nr:hypothetical protein [Nitrospirota bacterium]
MEHIQQLSPAQTLQHTAAGPSQTLAILGSTFAWVLRIGVVAILFVIPLAAYAM